jgi:DNA-binding MarR family transcriptional regulator
MATPLRQSVDTDQVWHSYGDNFPRHLLGVTRYLQTETMNALQQDCGHNNLRLAFAPYITLLGQKGKRLTDLAQVLGISRQACNQAANQIETAGYITRTADPDDGRAKQLVLTTRGLQLREDGIGVITSLDNEFAGIAGNKAVDDATKTLGRIHAELALGLTADDTVKLARASLGALLPSLSDYVMRRLMKLTQAKGHPGLKLSFGQVLTLIGPNGGRIQQIAAVQDVSKQAISAIATELVELGYLQRDPDPSDARQVVLQFTDRGRELIANSVASVVELETEFCAVVGTAAIKRLQATFRTLYRALHLEQEIFENAGPIDIRLLARQLHQQLGSEGSRALARLLLTPADNERSKNGQ